MKEDKFNSAYVGSIRVMCGRGSCARSIWSVGIKGRFIVSSLRGSIFVVKLISPILGSLLVITPI